MIAFKTSKDIWTTAPIEGNCKCLFTVLILLMTTMTLTTWRDVMTTMMRMTTELFWTLYTLLKTMFMKCQLNMMLTRLSYWDKHQLWTSGRNLVLGWSPSEHKSNGPNLNQIGPQGPPGGTLEKTSQNLKICFFVVVVCWARVKKCMRIYRQSLTFSSITKKCLLANFNANIDIFIIHRQPVTISVTVFSILAKNNYLLIFQVK